MGRPKHQDNPHVFDISKPGRSAPSHTSRPVIMDHRQISEDPMVTGNTDDTGLMTHTRPVVPINVSSHSDEHPEEPPAEEAGARADNFFGNSAEAPAGEQKYTPPEASTPPPASPEPDSGFQNGSEPAPHQASDSDKPPADPPTESDAAPLPVELTAPELDDPVGLSSVDSQAVPPANLVDTLGQTQNPDQEHEVKDGSTPGNPDPQQNPADQLPAVPENIGEIEPLPFPAHSHHGHFDSKPRRGKWGIPALIILLVGIFFILDAGVIGSGNLPFEIIKEQEEALAEDTPAPKPADTAPPASTPAPQGQPGLSQYVLAGTPLSFSYPAAWGNPVVSAEAGFSKRGGTNKSDGTYTHLISFETNKDVQLALTSSKFLPANRAAQYYDYLQWCSGTHDGKIYRQKLLFSTASGVDTPTTITCSDGPVADAAKLDELTIVQKNAKDAAGKTAGDIYTKNLSSGEFVVLRVKDSAMTSSEPIKALLSSVKLASQSASPN